MDEIADVLTPRPISLIETVAEHVKTKEIKTIGLLASPVTIKSGLYHDALEGIANVVCLDTVEQQHTEEIIRSVMANHHTKMQPELKTQIDLLQQADIVLLGCTELSVLADESLSADVVDPLDLVINRIFQSNSGEA